MCSGCSPEIVWETKSASVTPVSYGLTLLQTTRLADVGLKNTKGHFFYIIFFTFSHHGVICTTPHDRLGAGVWSLNSSPIPNIRQRYKILAQTRMVLVVAGVEKRLGARGKAMPPANRTRSYQMAMSLWGWYSNYLEWINGRTLERKANWQRDRGVRRETREGEGERRGWRKALRSNGCLETVVKETMSPLASQMSYIYIYIYVDVQKEEVFHLFCFSPLHSRWIRDGRRCAHR